VPINADEAEFSAGTFRENLAELTGEEPTGYDAHHIFPQAFREEFERLGFTGENSIDNPKYGTWWESMSHRALSNVYNDYWEYFLYFENPSAEDVLTFGRVMGDLFGFPVYY